jgi:hypothetical protein
MQPYAPPATMTSVDEAEAHSRKWFCNGCFQLRDSIRLSDVAAQWPICDTCEKRRIAIRSVSKGDRDASENRN